MVLAEMPPGVSVYAPISVSPLPCPLCSQLAKRVESQKETKFTGLSARPLMVLYVYDPGEPERAMPPKEPAISVLYSEYVSVAALAFRNAAYCALVTSVCPMLYV